MKYRKKEFHFWTPKYILKTTNYILKYLERKQTMKPFLTSTQSIKLLKNSIPCSQALWIKRICSTKKDFDPHLRELEGEREIHVSKMGKLRSSVFPLEQENALHVYRAQELYVGTKC